MDLISPVHWRFKPLGDDLYFASVMIGCPKCDGELNVRGVTGEDGVHINAGSYQCVLCGHAGYWAARAKSGYFESDDGCAAAPAEIILLEVNRNDS